MIRRRLVWCRKLRRTGTPCEDSLVRPLYFAALLLALTSSGVAAVHAQSLSDATDPEPSVTSESDDAANKAQPSPPARSWALPCQTRTALTHAAQALLAEAEAQPTPRALRQALSAAEVDWPHVTALFGQGENLDEVSSLLARVRSRGPGPLVCGLAQKRASYLLLAAVAQGTLSPVANSTVAFRLARPLGKPWLAVRDSAGGLHRLAPFLVSKDEEGALQGEFSLGDLAQSAAFIQLMAEGQGGPRPVAQRTLRKDYRPPLPTHGDPTQVVDARRNKHGVSALRNNRLLTEAALEQAKSVCDLRRAAHVNADGLDPEARLRTRGIVARAVGEVVARGASVGAALDALVRSPSHELTMVQPNLTDVGVGVVQDRDGHACVVVLFAAWPRYVPR